MFKKRLLASSWQENVKVSIGFIWKMLALPSRIGHGWHPLLSNLCLYYLFGNEKPQDGVYGIRACSTLEAKGLWRLLMISICYGNRFSSWNMVCRGWVGRQGINNGISIWKSLAYIDCNSIVLVFFKVNMWLIQAVVLAWCLCEPNLWYFVDLGLLHSRMLRLRMVSLDSI